MGRKKAELDYNIIDTALFYGATMEQLRFLLEKKGTVLSRKTVERCIQRDKDMPFSEYRKFHHGGAKFKIAQKQFEIAMSGNPAMLIWLGKNWLDQSDKQDVSIDGKAIQINVDKDDEGL